MVVEVGDGLVGNPLMTSTQLFGVGLLIGGVVALALSSYLARSQVGLLNNLLGLNLSDRAAGRFKWYYLGGSIVILAIGTFLVATG